jgi:pimeloyl-ACP methyl ester carboxylesterase
MSALRGPEAQFDVESFFAVLSQFGQLGATLLSPAVNIPALALFGAQDPVTPFEEHRSAIEAGLPDGRLEVLDGCSHYLHLDRPRHFVDLVVEWAATHSRTAVEQTQRQLLRSLNTY